MSSKKLIIGFITYNDSTAKYLPYFLASLKNQAFKDFRIIAQDNSDNENNENRRFIKENYPPIELAYSGANLGFARANNRLIGKAIAGGEDYILLLNPDMLLEPRAVDKMLSAIMGDAELGSVAPKIYRWQFDIGSPLKGKTEIIDSCGIKEISALRFADIGQGEADTGQYDRAEILGPSGAAAMYRIKALEKTKDKHGYFDERMFMYKEDCDLAYRLKLAGYKSKLVPAAIAYHDRTTAAAGEGNLAIARNRQNKSRQVREWSFSNQRLIFKKHWPTLGLGGKISVLWYAARMFVYALLFERYLLKK